MDMIGSPCSGAGLYVPKRFRNSSFASFSPDAEEPTQARALEAVMEWCARVEASESAMLALIGPPGTGKTHLLYSAAKQLDSAGIRVLSRPWLALSEQLRFGGPAPFSPRHHLEPYELRRKVLEQPVLLIDEIRPTSGTAFDDTELAKLIANAWDNEGAMLITTNVNPLRDVIGDAPASRFRQVMLLGRDRRSRP